jgi:acyl carrier protein
MSDATEAAVLAALAEELGRPPASLTPDLGFAEDLGVDSLDFVRVVQAVEEASGLTLDDKEAAAARTVGALLALVRRTRDGG